MASNPSNLESTYTAASDPVDTIARIQSLGETINLDTSSSIVKIADGLFSVERGRLNASKQAVRTNLADWSSDELDGLWGTLLGVEQLPGIDSVDTFLGNPTYASRIRNFMAAVNIGASAESIRVAAQSGSGVSMKITSDGLRVILIPQGSLTPAQEAGALKAAYRVAPAISIIEIGELEELNPFDSVKFYTPTYYIGEPPSTDGLTGPVYDGPNVLDGASSDEWEAAPDGSLAPGTGEPSEVLKGRAWHTSPLAYGESAYIDFHVEDNTISSRLKFDFSNGRMGMTITDDLGNTLHNNTVLAATNSNWSTLDLMLPMAKRQTIRVYFQNVELTEVDLFVRNVYVGARVTTDNRDEWLKLGGLLGSDPTVPPPVAADGSSLNSTGGQWISAPASSPTETQELWTELSGIPVRVSAVYFKTETPGCLFTISYSNANVSVDEVDDWRSVPGIYTLETGRIAIHPVKARHLRFVFTNLQSKLLKQYHLDGINA